MCDLIPLILHDEYKKTKKEISGQPLSVIFDSTSRMGESLAIVIRFVSEGWQSQQRLIRVQLITKHSVSAPSAQQFPIL